MISKKVLALLVGSSVYAEEQLDLENMPWMDKGETPEKRAQDLVDAMNITEKASMLRGRGSMQPYTGHTAAIERVGIPQINCNDGPQGFRTDNLGGLSTQYPSALTVGASWDEELIYKYGAAMGKEFYDKGSQIQLGPGLNVNRVDAGGRNFEYVSGEDPYLGYKLSQPLVKGIQDQNVMANAKHYINNNQETDRTTVNENVDERTRFEMYYPPFEGAIEAGVGSFMCSYNLINGEHACQNNSTLNTDLRERLGFKGYVMSDWGATHAVAVEQGLEQEMDGGDPTTLVYTEEAIAALPIDEVNEAVYRILWASISTGVFDAAPTQTGTVETNTTTPESKISAREMSEESAVLLKNRDNTLPLNFTETRKLLIVGQDDISFSPITGGLGSGRVDASWIQAPVNEAALRLGVEPFVSKEPAFDGPQRHCDETGNSCVIYGGGDCHDPSCIPDDWDYDATIVFVGAMSGEGSDRNGIGYTEEIEDMVYDFTAAGKKQGTPTIVVVSAPGMTILPWSSKVDAQIANFYAGEQMSQAVFSIIEGVINPSGKLPITLPNADNEQQMSKLQYPGLPDTRPGIDLSSNYTEKLLMGYRWYDYHNVEPMYPFGHGLSYTTFKYDSDSLKIEDRNISITVTNSGKVTGKEVVQLYVGFPEEAGEPPQMLKGFKKIELDPRQSSTVEFTLRDRDLSIWDVDTHDWQLISGDFKIFVGSSSRDIRAESTLTVSTEQDELFLPIQ